MARICSALVEMQNTDQRAVPPQHTGAKSDIEHSVTLKTVDHAKSLFSLARKRLLDMSNWDKISDVSIAQFQLTTMRGKEVFRNAQRGDKLRISIPAPNTETGDGFDWVEVEEIRETNENTETESIAIRVRPCASPLNQSLNTAHFFTSDATSSFVVMRRGTTVKAEVHGRNEKPNTGESTNLFDKARNAAVAIGALVGMNKPQWNALVKGLLKTDRG